MLYSEYLESLNSDSEDFIDEYKELKTSLEEDGEVWTEEEVKSCIDSIKKKISSDDYEYADSFRAAKVGNKKQLKTFKKLRTCCGSEEWKELIDSVEYLLGFNYGH